MTAGHMTRFSVCGRGASSLVHYWYHPDSYDRCIPAEVAPEVVEPDKRIRGDHFSCPSLCHLTCKAILLCTLPAGLCFALAGLLDKLFRIVASMQRHKKQCTGAFRPLLLSGRGLRAGC